MSALREPSLSDPLSLDGLEPLLDQIFSVQYEFAPRDCVQAPTATSGSTPMNGANPTSGAQTAASADIDFHPAQDKDDFLGWVVSQQLNATVLALKSYQDKCRWLELKLATKNDQLEYMPELFTKTLMYTAVQAENEELKRENGALLEIIENMRPKIDQPSMGRRILNRFFGT